MNTFILILFFHVGPMGEGNSNAVTTISGFKSEAECMQAGTKAQTLVARTVKELNYTCVKQTKD